MPQGNVLPASYDTAAAGEIQELSVFWEMLLRRWRLFALIAGGFVAVVAAVTLLTPKSYTTTVRVMAGNPAQSTNADTTTLPVLNALILQNGVESAETFATLAQQEGVADEVVRRVDLRMPALALLNHVSVVQPSNTAILNLSVSWNEPPRSAAIANAFADAFMNKERDFVRSQAVAAIGFLSGELPRAQAAMQKAGSDLASFQAANGFVDANTHTQDVVNKETDLESKIQTANLDRREALALLKNSTAQLAGMAPTIDNAQQQSINPVLTDLQTKLEQVNLQLAQAMEQYTDRHPLVISLKKQRADLMASIARQPQQINSANTISPNPIYQSLQQQVVQYTQRIDADAAQLQLLKREQANMAPMLRRLPQQSVQLATLQQRAKLASDVYNALQQKYDDATVAKTTALSDISIVQPATADSAVVRPNLRLNILAAAVVGVLLALIVVIGLERWRRPVSHQRGSGSLLGLPVLARIPTLDTANKRMLPWLQSMTLESFLQLCVALKLKSSRRIRTLAITSPSRSDGKSTVAFNLAKAMSKLEPHILLIDADFRRPSLHDLSGSSNKHGLTDVLERRMTLSEAIQQLSATLDMLPAGQSVPNPVRLLQSAEFEALMREAAEGYDMVIVDTPALSCVTEGYLVMAKADASLLVVASNTTSERETREIMSQCAALGIENFVGVVLNRDHRNMTDYSDYFAQRAPRPLPGTSA